MKRLIYILFAWLLMAACEDKEAEVVFKTSYDISEAEVVIPASGDMTDYLLVTANTDWTITGGTEWCRVSPDAGTAGTTRVYFDLDENLDYSDRSVQFTLNVAGEKRIITVFQKQKDALTISKDKFDFGQKGGNVELKLNTNIVDQVRYTIVTPGYAEPWIAPSQVPASKAIEEYDLVFAVAENPDGAKREGMVIVEDELRRFSDTIRVYQVQKDMIVLSQDVYKVPFEGHDNLIVELKHNIAYGVEISAEGKDWISEVPATKALQPDKRIFKVEEYPAEVERQADIIFYDLDNPSLRDTITVQQLRIGVFFIPNDRVENVPQAGGTAEYDIDANVNYEVIVPERVDWVRPRPMSRALATSKVVLEVDPNPADKIERETKVILRSTDAEEVVTDTIYVHQLGRPRVSEYKILMALADALKETKNFYNTALAGWGDPSGNEQITEDWRCVTLNAEGHVIGINLNINNLKGSIPAELGELKYLEKWDNYYSQDFAGDIPASLGNLKNLKSLNLQGEFTSMPEELGDLENLEVLDLRCAATNAPTFIGGLANLTKLELMCQYAGPVPAEIGNLKNLTQLTIGRRTNTNVENDSHYNNFTSLPVEIGELANLISCVIYGGFEGANVPAEIGKLTQLTTLTFTKTGFVSLPEELGNLKNIEGIDWSGNKFKAIPEGMGYMEGLTSLKLYDNELEGEIPETFANLVNLTTLHLYDNKLSGSIEVLKNLPLSSLEISNNQLEGSIDFDWSGTNLSTFEAANNKFIGNIPTSLFNMPRLKTLDLSGNQLTGELPAEVEWDVNETLKEILLQNNQLSGSLPQWLCNTELTDLDLENNNFTGTIPNMFGTGFNNFLVSNSTFNLNGNRLSGEIPKAILKELVSGNQKKWFIVDQQEGYRFDNWDYSK